MTTLLTTTIPYVNAAPHLGFALEAVQADVLARHHRRRGELTRFLSGTDDNSLKNVLAAERLGLPVGELVDRNAAAFQELAGPLRLSYDDFIRTSTDPRHRTGVAALWAACDARGDFYQSTYDGLYCVGCEHYLTPDDLVDGNCPEHGQPPQRLTEDNWFFRLSRYGDRLRAAIESGELRIEPIGRRNEVLAFIDAGLKDFSISRSVQRARGWGIPVPGDPTQVIYVWWDALGNYVTGLGFGGPDDRDYDTFWARADRRIHLLGKGVLRFHAVYWPAMLLSAGLPLPTDLLVHDYLTANGERISKSGGNSVDPVDLVRRFGTDAVRWWLLSEVPRVGDADFTEARLAARANADLAGGFGNLVNRVVTMIAKYFAGVAPRVPSRADDIDIAIDKALADYDFRAAVAAVIAVVDGANRLIDQTRPWQLAKSGTPDELASVLGDLLGRCRLLGEVLAPFLPDAAAAITRQTTPIDGVLPAPSPLFPRW
jgi:methionyl-tRNA synthetase